MNYNYWYGRHRYLLSTTYLVYIVYFTNCCEQELFMLIIKIFGVKLCVPTSWCPTNT